MPQNILMPALSPTMTEGKLIKWLKKEGDKVKSGQVIAEIETDKATMEVEAVDEGTLARILVAEGTEGVKVNTLIAVLLEEGEDAAALGDVANSNTSARNTPTPAQAGAQSASPPEQKAAAPSPAPASADKLAGKRLFVSPLARRIAQEKGVDLSAVKGSGPHGRIVKADVESSTPAQAGAQTPSAWTPASAGVGKVASGPDAKALADAYGIPYTLIPNSGVRKVIAKRLAESKQTVPHFYLSVDCELDALLKLRKEINDAAEGYKISVNDFVIKATGVALKKFPAVNVSWTDDAVVQYERADVSVAVSTDGGLITPIIKDAAGKSLKDISNEMKDLAARARAGKLKPQEFQGGTISVSNLGMFGVRDFAAIVNPPQGSILAVGAGEQRAVVKDGQVKAATVMTVTLSLDHRAIDGSVGAEYLQVFKTLIEKPLGLLL